MKIFRTVHLMKTQIHSHSKYLTQEYLYECFSVCFETGRLVWKKRPLHHFKDERIQKSFNTKYSGKICCNPITKRNNVYHRVCINDTTVYSHQVIWIMFYGWMNWEYEIDHVDRNSTNNSIRNLRLSDRHGQNYNRLMTGKSVKGSSYDKNRDKWQMQIVVKGNKIAGRFQNDQSALFVYQVLSDHFHGSFNSLQYTDFDSISKSFDWSGVTPTVRKALLDVSDKTKIKYSKFFEILQKG